MDKIKQYNIKDIRLEEVPRYTVFGSYMIYEVWYKNKQLLRTVEKNDVENFLRENVVLSEEQQRAIPNAMSEGIARALLALRSA